MTPSQKPLYQELAAAIGAWKRCADKGDAKWSQRWSARILQLQALLPDGAGIDRGTRVDLHLSHDSKLVMYADFNHMNPPSNLWTDGCDGWSTHTITVTPTFDGFNLRISGRNRNYVKDHLHDIFSVALGQDSPEWPDSI